MGAGRLARFRHAVWPEPACPLERRMLRKVDALVLSFLCLQYCVNYLDRVNYLNAYVSGLREALNMQGRDYNNVITCFTVGFALANIPQNLLLLVMPARWLFSVNALIWGILTCLTACAKNVKHLYVIKFFQGMAEASTFVGAHYILGSWYLPSELGRRSAIFAASGHAATLFSGSLMASIHTHLNGKQGIAGWQWMFIICGVITIPVAIYGFFAFPDTPATSTSRFLSAEERALAITRLPVKPRKTGMSWSLWARVLGRWHVWALSVMWIAGGSLEAYGSWGIMALWMRAQRSTTKVNPATGLPAALYTVKQLNYHPLGIAAVAIVALLVAAILTDRHPSKRYLINFVVAGCALVYGIIPLVGAKKYRGRPSAALPVGSWYFAFYLSGISFAGQMSNFTWCNEIVVGDDEERGIVLATMNVIAYAFNAWFQPVFWAASSAPQFTQGFSLIVAFVPILILSTALTRYLQLREHRQRRERGEDPSQPVTEGEKADDQDDKLGTAESVLTKEAGSRPTTATSMTEVSIDEAGRETVEKGIVHDLQR
ncbi:hypothetical protein JCM11251_000337 [Rhodosporidiobolus azoricus]